jgi:hypothetical protein
MDYWKYPKVGGFFFGGKKWSLGYKKKGGGWGATCKNTFFWGKKGLPYFEGGKKKLNSPYLDHGFVVCRQ